MGAGPLHPRTVAILAVKTSDKHRSIKLCKTITLTKIRRETDGPISDLLSRLFEFILQE
jgi:hypothetical protein